ncbi:XRE family transcriptional regulator [Rothia nasimurium]|uniref:XRE family transcriptional regulator n=1 Tax=Rothia nasimurium TaxID=85336 RepID=A0A4Y9F2Z9_9MICC|nr:helix-turn-helix transcriptional regulator [Rothia nasimurium]MBF0808374.1 helix-turn-helix transcriptional regulator [Rothia nasimurium]TFU22192.1 XRE family transcriptional regulator [Rothia nasimurium]
MNTPTWTFQDRLRKAREHAGMTQSELAEATGVSLNSLNRYEKGQRSPANDVVSAIAQATNVPLEWFYQDDDTQPVAIPTGDLPASLTVRWTPGGIEVDQ